MRSRRFDSRSASLFLFLFWCSIPFIFHLFFLGTVCGFTRYLDLIEYNEARPRERSDRGRFFPIGKKASSYRGAIQGAIISFACLSVRVTFVVFTDFESCTRPIFTNPGSMGADKHGLTRGTFRRASSRGGRGRRAAVDSWCVLVGADFFGFLFSFFFSSSNAHGLLQV